MNKREKSRAIPWKYAFYISFLSMLFLLHRHPLILLPSILFQRLFNRAMDSLYKLLKKPYVVPGGGCFETLVAKCLLVSLFYF